MHIMLKLKEQSFLRRRELFWHCGGIKAFIVAVSLFKVSPG